MEDGTLCEAFLDTRRPKEKGSCWGLKRVLLLRQIRGETRGGISRRTEVELAV